MSVPSPGLTNFLYRFNNLNPSVKYSLEHSFTDMNFLDYNCVMHLEWHPTNYVLHCIVLYYFPQTTALASTKPVIVTVAMKFVIYSQVLRYYHTCSEENAHYFTQKTHTYREIDIFEQVTQILLPVFYSTKRNLTLTTLIRIHGFYMSLTDVIYLIQCTK